MTCPHLKPMCHACGLHDGIECSIDASIKRDHTADRPNMRGLFVQKIERFDRELEGLIDAVSDGIETD